MTRQNFARIKLKCYNAGKRAGLCGTNPGLPDFKGGLDDLQEFLNALYDGYAEGVAERQRREASLQWR